MAFEQEQREALQLLQGIENGTMEVVESGYLIKEADPALVYLIISWLRSCYGADQPAAAGVVGRLVELTENYPSVNAKMREGKEDLVVAWFEEAYSYRDFTATDFIALVVDKLEG